MQENLKDILGSLSTDIDQETLLLYLQGKLSGEEQHHVEKQLVENDFASDALEGLQKIKNEQHLNLLIEQLNRDLKARTAKKTAARRKRQLGTDPLLLIALAIILLLIIISYLIIQKHAQ